MKSKKERNRKGQSSPVIFFVLLLLSGKTLFAQGAAEDDFALHSFGIQLSAGVMPKPKIRSSEDYYKMHAGVQPSFDAAFYYTTNTGEFWTYSLGVGVTLIASHYYLHIPDADLSGYPSTQGAPQIEDKQAYFQLKVPIRLAYKFRRRGNGYWSMEGGFDLKYSGFSSDEHVGTFLGDDNNQVLIIHTGSFSSNNGHKPWLTATLAVARAISTSRSSSIIIQTFIEGSITHSIEGDYQITIPGKPVSSGNISFRESRIGLSLGYCFGSLSR